ncbi:MAG: energy-coupling factor transporter ATPase [Clostridia bacterium]
MSYVLETENLTYIYGAGTPFQTTALDNVSVGIEAGELLAIIGHTGSGKSTLIQHFNGILSPTSGRVMLDGKDIWSDKKNIRSVRFRVGLCFQYPEYQLFEETVYKDIAFGPRNMGLGNTEIDERVREAAEYVGLKQIHLDASPFDLSGGEKRRAAIAGVIAMRPEILILDEPTAGLDPAGRDAILNLVKNYREQTGATVIVVSHSMEDVAQIATKVMVVHDARVAMYGTVEEVFSHAEELVQMGLNVPQITQVFSRLNHLGYPVPKNIYTVEQGRRTLLDLLGRGDQID